MQFWKQNTYYNFLSQLNIYTKQLLFLFVLKGFRHSIEDAWQVGLGWEAVLSAQFSDTYVADIHNEDMSL